MNAEIKKIKVGARFRKDLGDLESLKASIKERGLFHPVVVDKGLHLLAGERRLAACKALGWKEIPITTISPDAPIHIERDENMERKQFTETEAWQIAKALMPLEKEKAKERSGTRTDLGPPVKFSGGEALDRVAAAVGRSRPTLEKIGKIVDSGRKELIAEMDRTGKVDRVYQIMKRETQHSEMKERATLPDSKYAVIYADPPWQYANSGLAGAAEDHYPTMPTPKICEMEIEALCEQNAVLFLWTTNPLLPDALDIMDAWGFSYKTNFVWVKDRGTYGKLGFYNRGRHELLLIGTRGTFIPFTKELPDSVITEAKEKHSQKPASVYATIGAMYPGVKCLELFARSKRAGWDSHGNQI